MPLINQTPTTIAAIPEKTFPHAWIYNMSTHAPTTTSGRIALDILPYNAETDELGKGVDKETISTDELWLAIEQVPELSQAMAAILTAVGPLRTWVAARKVELEAEQEAPEA